MYIDLPSLEQWLNQFYNFERSPSKTMLSLETMRILCSYFDHPEQASPCFHVGGSKGKGTIANGIAAILRDQGYSTGVYTSPHVTHFTERVSSGEGAFPLEIYATAEQELRSGIEELVATHQLDKSTLTWCEMTAIFAMLVFRLAKVDYAVYEVNMGGRLDTTNIITPEAIAMGPIELEHTKFLGDTLTKIATEKAAIFKENVPVISAPQAPEVQAIFRKQATKTHNKVQFITGISDYQVLDATISATTVRQILPALNLDHAVTVALDAHLPGRYERIENYHNIPYILLDGAHTANSVRAILDRMKREGVRGNLIFACAADKNVEQMATLITNSGLFDAIFLTRPGDLKASDLPRAIAAFKSALSSGTSNAKLHISPDYTATINTAIQTSSTTNTPLIAFGSFYLLAEITKSLASST